MTETTDPTLTIRPAEASDAEAIATLFTDEGYPAGPSDIVLTFVTDSSPVPGTGRACGGPRSRGRSASVS